MSRVLLINPTITAKRNARFPLGSLHIADAIEPRHQATILDGNIDRDFVATALRMISEQRVDAVGVSVMGGPQLPQALRVSEAIRRAAPSLPVFWGGQFPTIFPEAALEEPCVDYAIRAQGEDTAMELLDALESGDRTRLPGIAGLSWKRTREDSGGLVHNADRPFAGIRPLRRLSFERFDDPKGYLGHTFLGRRTAGYQAAVGCRFRCTFCGVATMFKGKTTLPSAVRLDEDLTFLTRTLGADSIQFYDHNFFDREADTQPLLEVLARHRIPWWCFARSDALVNLSTHSWKLVRESALRMAYIGAESPSDSMLREIRKGTKADQTLEAVKVCRANGVIPELSFMLAPPQDPEGETEKTFEFVREVKRIHPQTEIMLYVYTPLPTSPHVVNKLHPRAIENEARIRDVTGNRVHFPKRASEWARADWVSYWCHTDAPWLTPRLRQRIRDFNTVLGCRFPTITDVRSPTIAKRALRLMSAWRYRFARYDRPWELDLTRHVISLHDPKAASL
jgi:anaerobic magnesium-protoporphyrin IX monomethyl ester cyclase